MNNLPETVNIFLSQNDLFDSNKTFLVAFSGGFDSSCLLHILKNITKNRIIAIHLNHNWRGDDSEQDELNCKNFCKKLNIEFYSEKLSDKVPKTETHAREARYKFFMECAKKYNSDVIFTAHNANDNAETVLYRITKGTGIDGLSGIAEIRKPFYRPLLKITRQEIEDYCAQNKLQPNIDKSNFDTKYKRNFIRYDILPKLELINPKVINVINSLSELAKEDSELINEITQKIGNNTKKFIAASNSVKYRIIKNLLIEHNINYDRKRLSLIINFIEKFYNSKSGKTYTLSDKKELYINSDYFKVITTITTNNIYVNIDSEGTYNFKDSVLTIKKCNKIPKKFPVDSENMIYVNLNEINFTLRLREPGDYICPLGLNGTQKLKKYFNEKKIPPFKKDNIPLLCKNKEVLWVIGIGISDKIKVTNKITHIIKYRNRRDVNAQY